MLSSAVSLGSSMALPFAQFDHVAVVQLRIHVGSDFAVDGGVKRLALSCFDHRAVHGNEIAGFRLDAAGAQRVFQRLVTAYFQVAPLRVMEAGRLCTTKYPPTAKAATTSRLAMIPTARRLGCSGPGGRW